MHSRPGPGAQMLFRYEIKKLDTTSLLVPWSGEYSCVVCRKEYFSSVAQVLCWIVSNCSVAEIFAIVLENLIDYILVNVGSFFIGICLVSMTSFSFGLKPRRIAQMGLLFDDIKTFRYLIGRAFCSVLWKCPLFRATGVSNIYWCVLMFQKSITY